MKQINITWSRCFTVDDKIEANGCATAPDGRSFGASYAYHPDDPAPDVDARHDACVAAIETAIRAMTPAAPAAPEQTTK